MKLEPKTLSDLPRFARDLLEASRVARMGLLDDHDRPRVLPVTFALDGDCVVTAVDHKPKRNPAGEPARVRFLRRRPEAALTADRYSDDWSQLAWVQVLGEVEILAAGQAPVAVAALCAKYPQYRERPPQGPVLRLLPGRILCWAASLPALPP